jgi:hypothetical protein
MFCLLLLLKFSTVSSVTKQKSHQVCLLVDRFRPIATQIGAISERMMDNVLSQEITNDGLLVKIKGEVS